MTLMTIRLEAARSAEFPKAARGTAMNSPRR